MSKFAFKPEKSKLTRRSFMTGGASTIARSAARGLISAPEEEYYYHDFSGVAGREAAVNGAQNAAYDEEAGMVHHHTHPNGTKVYKDSDGGYLLRTKARSKAEAHTKFSSHPEYHSMNSEPEWDDEH